MDHFKDRAVFNELKKIYDVDFVSQTGPAHYKSYTYYYLKLKINNLFVYQVAAIHKNDDTLKYLTNVIEETIFNFNDFVENGDNVFSFLTNIIDNKAKFEGREGLYSTKHSHLFAYDIYNKHNGDVIASLKALESTGLERYLEKI